MSIQENIAEIRRRIAVACAECGRDPKEVRLPMRLGDLRAMAHMLILHTM